MTLPEEVITQRLVIVVPTTAEFDSRTYRIASGLAARGHEVTVMGRLKAGLAADEQHAAGYRIRRVPVSTIDGLPFPGLVRALRTAVRRFYAWRTGTPFRPIPPSGSSTTRSGQGAGRSIQEGPGTLESAAPAADHGASLPRRAAADLVRRLAIPLQIRSQLRETRRVAPRADLYHGMAYMGIPIALDLARRHGAKVVYDARDIYLEAANLARMRGPARRLLARAERGWARRADRVVTVNRPYAEVIASRFGVELPLIVMNCSYRNQPGEPRERRFHDVLGLPAERRVVLYQGGFSRDRGIEQLLAAIPEIPNATLVLMGYGYLEDEIRSRAADPAIRECVAVLLAVAPTELLDWVAGADVVAMPIQPTTLNHRLTTPNKLFEAMAAGVPVVASDLPGMAPIVAEVDCGVLVDPTDPHAIAAACRRLLDESPEAAAQRRARILRAAHDTYNWEGQLEVLLAEYGRLTGKPW
ncbi:MAG TPA: glycosyltransferase [Candidatus Limnocylindrales bacterium]